MKPTLIRSLLVLVLLAVQLATVVIVVLGMRQQTNEQFSQNARATLERLAETVSDRTQRYLRPAEAALRVAGRLVQAGVIDSRDDSALIHYFLAELRAHAPLQQMSVVRGDGRSVALMRHGEGYRSEREVVENGRPYRQLADLDGEGQSLRTWREPGVAEGLRLRPAVERARRSGDLVWLDVRSQAGQAGQSGPALEAALSMRAPDGTDAGVVGADIDIVPLHAFISGIPMASNGSAAIVDGQGRAVAYSHPERLQAMAKGGARLPRIEALADRPLRGLLEADLPAPSAEPVAGFRRFEVGGAEYYGLRQPFATAQPGLDWWLIAQAPADEFSGGLRNLFQQKLRTLIAAVLIPAIIAVLAVFGLTEPVYRLHEDATTDALTGCLNREEFRRRLEGMLRNRREMEYVDRVVVVAFDLDGFKSINDRLGHEAGDRVLHDFAQRLRERVRQDDLVGRLGGDEFALALRVDRAVDVETMINGVRRSLVTRPFDTTHGRRLLGVTAGAACVETGESPEHVLARADQALITGKARRKNRVYMAPPTGAQWPNTQIGGQATIARHRPQAPVDGAGAPARPDRFLQI
ncbi:MAG: sensor domain-containing diguanylate cyclase [Burkholderiaceae bacterium]